MGLVTATAAANAGLVFSGFLNPCHYLQVHLGKVAINHFTGGYPGAESLGEIQRAVDQFCFAPEREAVLTRHYDERRAQYRLGTGNCTAGLRKPPRWTTGTVADVLIDDFKVLAEWIQDAGVPVTGKFVNIGASDGIESDPLASYSNLSRVGGIAVETDKRSCEAYRRNFPGVHLLCLTLTPQLVPRLARMVAQFAKGPYDVLKVDIDSFDCEVVSLFVKDFGHRPHAVLLEVNVAFPPPVEFSMGYSNSSTWNSPIASSGYSSEFALAYGCSLSHAVRLLGEVGYVLLQLVRKDALFLRDDVAEKLLGTRERPDEFECYASNLLEVRGVNVSLVRRWSYGEDLPTLVEEMRGLARADLQQRLGNRWTRAPFKLEVNSEPMKVSPVY